MFPMRRATSARAALLAAGGLAASCAPALDRVSPQLPEFRIAVIARPVAGRCRTTTIPALAFVTARQTVTWELISVDRAACKPEDIRIAVKPRPGAARATSEPPAQYPDGGGFKPVPGERPETLAVRTLRPGRYQYNVTIGAETEDPEIEVWR
jgi:hypothetical protein